MIKFSTFIKEAVLMVEGGNLPFVDPNKPHEGPRVSDSIDSSRREKEGPEFRDMFHSIDKGFQEHHGHNLFGNALKNNTFASGSSEVYNDPKVSHERFKAMKPTMGDYDVQIPKEHKEKLTNYLKPGQVHGKFTVVHTTGSGSQVHAVVRHNETGLHHQIDFEPVHYDEKKKEPTEFEKFAHNSHPDDLESGLKGVDHKFLLQSTLAAHSKPAIISTMKGRGKARAEHHEEGEYTPHSFSVDKGVREKWEKIGEKDGKPIVREKPSKGAEYSTDMHHIYKTMFNREPSDQDVKDIHSFHGLVKHIKAHIPKEHHQKIFDTYTNKLWHSSAQERSIDPEVDRKSKESAHAVLSKEFPDEAKASNGDTEKKKAEYYDPNGKKFKRGARIPSEEAKNPDNMSESSNEDFHVAVAAGRFTGPTKEHQKLLDNFFSQKADKHHVFVMGPESKEKTTAKDPLTVDEKIHQLKKLYPEKADSFVPGTHRHTSNPMKAITWAWHQHQKPGRNVHLTVIGGSGEAGIEKKSKAGGSLDSYKDIVNSYNGTRFPKSENPDGSVRGGDLRMDYKTTKFVENPRGTTSGSVMRKFATDHDHTNDDHVNQFKGMLHSGFEHEDARDLMKKVKERTSGIKESLYKTVINIIRESKYDRG